MTTTTQSSAKTERPAMSELDLRDYFAAKAMQGELSAQDRGRFYDNENKVNGLAAWSYDVADAMLAAREAKS